MVPIVFIHWGSCWHLRYAVGHARQHSPESSVHVLADEPGRHRLDAAMHAHEKHRGQADAFVQIYRHRSSHSVVFERRCFERWFMLLALMKEQQWDRCLHLDSDVLLFADAQREFDRLGCDISVSKGLSGHVCYITRQALARFCDELMDAYSRAERIEALDEWYHRYRASHAIGGVCDMTLLGEFARRADVKAVDLALPLDGKVYDDNLNVGDGFVSTSQGKAVFYDEGLPWVQDAATGVRYRLMAMHFQGIAKRMMPYHASGSRGFVRWGDWLACNGVHALLSIRRRAGSSAWPAAE